MKQLINKITTIGCNASQDELANKQIRLTNQMMMVQVPLSLLIVLIEVFNSYLVGLIAASVALIVGVVVIVANYYKKHLFSKLLLLLYAPVIIFFAVSLINEVRYATYFTVPLIFLVYISVSSLIMNIRTEKKWLFFCYFYYLFFLITYDKFFDYFFGINFFTDILQGNYLVVKLILGVTSVMLFFAFYFLHRENNRSQTELEHLLSVVNLRNTDLREHKEELLQNVEELERMQKSLITTREERERFLEAVSLGNMLIEYAIDGSVIKANDYVYEVFHGTEGGLGNISELNLKNQMPILEYVTFFDAIKDGEVLKKELVFNIENRVYYTDFSFSPIYNEEGVVDRVIAIGKDSTQSVLQKQHIEVQSLDILNKNELLLSSIRYAQRIQNAMMKSAHVMDDVVKDQFILYKPKDIVSGDFHWVRKTETKLFIGACDCTGHGVPGALVSIIGNQLLNRAIGTFGLDEPAQILNKVAELLDEELNTEGSDVLSDGMDVALLSIDLADGHLEFAGAFSPLYLVSDEGVRVVKGDKKPIGRYWDQNVDPQFTNHHVELAKNEMVYLFSDGYMDQFGGEFDKKFGRMSFKDFLVQIHHKPLEVQKEELDAKLISWKGDSDQVDDILVMGVRV